ncbi:dynein regulatory complex subunit 4-like [Synchiropus picturatus]
MPPKTKSKKTGKVKSPSAEDALTTDEMSKDQMEQHIVRLREELEREREERNYFQLERNKIQDFWEICKRDLEETKAELRSRRREKEEEEERHRVEISIYKQKLKQVLSEQQHAAVSAMKIDSLVSSSLVLNHHTESEQNLHRRTHVQQSEVRQKQLHNQNHLNELQQKHQVELMDLMNHYDQRHREMEEKYHRKVMLMSEEEHKRRKASVSEYEEQMKKRLEILTEEHSRAFRSAEEYYSSVQKKLLTDQQTLKVRGHNASVSVVQQRLSLQGELAEVKKQRLRLSRELAVVQEENRRLHESLLDAERKLPELTKQLEEHEHAKAQRKLSDARVQALEEQLRDVTVEHQFLLQAFHKVEQERDELLKKQQALILDVQQRSGVKDLLLERKLAALTEALEKNQALLSGTTVFLDPAVQREARTDVDLEEQITRLTEEMERERKEKTDFQLERKKIQEFWENCKRDLEKTKEALRGRRRERDEQEERHRLEITVYKHKLKQVQSEQQAAISEKKIEAAVTSTLVQNQFSESEQELHRKTQLMQTEVRQKKLNNQNCINELRQKHQVELMDLMYYYDRRLRDMEVKYHEKVMSLAEAENQCRKKRVSEYEEEMKKHLESLSEEHSRAFRSVEEYYSIVQKKLLVDQQMLRDNLAEVKKQRLRLGRELSTVQQENKSLRESLQEAERKFPVLMEQLEEHERAKAQRKVSDTRIQILEEQLIDVMVECELLLQAFHKVEQERDELLRKQRAMILDVQQRGGRKDLLLERKLATLSETLEQNSSLLCTVLSTDNLDPTAADRASVQLKEILDSKKAAVRALQDELLRDCQEYDQLLLSVQEKMINQSTEDFPFRAADVVLSG